MSDRLAPLRHAQHRLHSGESSQAIITELFMRFNLAETDATAAVAAVMLLNERGLDVPRERSLWAMPQSAPCSREPIG